MEELIPFFKRKFLAEAELFLLSTACAHPCSWAVCSPAQKLAKLGHWN